jgi:hydrogenase nickel incorporation protein HypB
MEHFDFNLDVLKERVKRINPTVKIIPISAKTGEGVDQWVNWVEDEVENNRAK